MTGPREIFEKFCSPRISILREEVPDRNLTELSILVYLVFFIAVSLSNVSLLSSTGWAPYEPYNPEPVNESILDDNSPDISAKYWDENGDDGSLEFYDDSGSFIDSCSVSNGSRCGVEWSGASAHDNYWYSIAEDNGGNTATGPWWYFLINNPPNSVSSPDNPADGSTVYNDSVSLEVTVTDPDGDDMDVEFLNNVSNSSYSQRVDNNVGNGEKASIVKDLQRGRTYKWWVNISDSWNSTKSSSWTFYVNTLPVLQTVDPADGSLVRGDTVRLNVSANDEEDDQFYAYFFNGGEFLGKDSGAAGEKLTSDQWSGLRLGSRYNWRVIASDGMENKTFGTFEFLRTSRSSYRILMDVDRTYSSLILSTGSQKLTSLAVENRLSEQKSINIYLDGLNAFFQRNGESKLGYTLEPYEREEFVVVVEPDSPGPQNLSITTEEIGLGLNTTEKVPALVRDVPTVAQSREVSGIGTIQIFMLVLTAVYLYSARL